MLLINRKKDWQDLFCRTVLNWVWIFIWRVVFVKLLPILLLTQVMFYTAAIRQIGNIIGRQKLIQTNFWTGLCHFPSEHSFKKWEKHLFSYDSIIVSKCKVLKQQLVYFSNTAKIIYWDDNYCFADAMDKPGVLAHESTCISARDQKTYWILE